MARVSPDLIDQSYLASSGSRKAHNANFYLLNLRVFRGLVTFGLHINVKIIVLDPMLIVSQIWKVRQYRIHNSFSY